jgi:hypothetical protein
MDGVELLSEAHAFGYTSRGVVWSGDPSANHKASPSREKTDFGEGQAIHTSIEFGTIGIRLEQEFLLLEGDSALLLTTRFTNLGELPLSLDCVVEADALAGSVSDRGQTTILTDSFNSWDHSGLELYPYHLRDKNVPSYYSVAIKAPPLVAGYLSGEAAMGTFEVRVNTWDHWGSLHLRTCSRFDDVVMAPGEVRAADPLYLAFPKSPEEGLSRYARLVKEKNHVKIWNQPYTTWCSWYAGYGRVAQADLKALETGTVANARLLVSEHLKELGIDAVRIVDDSSDQIFGDWNFPYVPSGMGTAAKRIRDLGIRPGVWLAPAFVSDTSRIFHNHPDWLQRNADGTFVVRKNFYGNTMYFLDPSHPGALDNLRKLFTRIRDWGYEYVMIDFMHMLVWGDKFHDSTLTKVQIYRRALQAIRDSLGSQIYLLGCGALMLPSVGLVDGMRVTNDTWGKDVRSPESMAARWFMHNNFWLNDPDAILTRDLSIAQAQAWATLMAVTGGVQTFGDNLLTLDPGRLEIVKKYHPVLYESGRPLDVFDRAQSSVWDLPLSTSFDQWHLLALFNWVQEDKPLKHHVDLAALMKSPGPFLVYEFWSNKFLGEFSSTLELEVPFWTTSALAIRQKSHYPQLISASNHISQGKVGLRDLNWDSSTNVLSGTYAAAVREPLLISLFVPKGYTPVGCEAQGALADLSKDSEQLWRVRLEPKEGLSTWRVQFTKSS